MLLYYPFYGFAFIQLIYWSLVFQRLAWYQAPKIVVPASFPPVSIVICARNEMVNLKKNLERILLQNYPVFELILVNDGSEDESLLLLQELQKKYPHLKIVHIEKKQGQGKKNALTKGIETAQYDWILLTDADCYPASSHWIEAMLESATQANSSIVLGYGPSTHEKGWLNKWVQFETIYVAIQYFSFALWKQPYMGVGRNLLYKKSLFVENQGFKNHQHLISGDDDLFVNEVANGQNTTICLDKDSFMYSPAPLSWAALYRQKNRHYSSSNHYQFKHKMLLGILSLSHFGFYAGLLFFLCTNTLSLGIFLLWILRFLFVHFIFFKYLTKVHYIQLFPYIAMLDVLLPLYYLIFVPTLLHHRPQNWN